MAEAANTEERQQLVVQIKNLEAQVAQQELRLIQLEREPGEVKANIASLKKTLSDLQTQLNKE